MDKSKLYEKHIHLVADVARRFKSSEYEDLYQEGFLGLVDAIEKHDPSKDECFKNFAKIKIEGKIRDYLRTDGKLLQMSRRSIDKGQKKIFWDRRKSEHLENLKVREDEHSSLDDVNYVVCLLSADEKKMMRLRYKEKKTLCELAVICECTVYQVRKKILNLNKKIKDILEDA